MKTLKHVLASTCLLGLSLTPGRAELNVVASLTTFADLAKTIGGAHVIVSSVAPPTFNPHFIEPRPSNVLQVKKADLFIHGGLDLEAWRSPLVNAAGNSRVRPGGDRELDLSTGIPLLQIPAGPLTRAMGDIHTFGNPHYWVSPDNARIMARAISAKLAEIDSLHAEAYAANLANFLAELTRKEQAWKSDLRPFLGTELVGYHDEWPYLMEYAGLKMDLFLEPKPGIPPGPKHMARVEAFIREHGVPAIVSASYQPQASAARVARKTGARLVLLCQNVNEVPAASDYIAMMDYNVEQLLNALRR